ncbi:hypothetical protein [Pseudomonas putida]|uniref:hypothetical protein n=1 Tax=Pseudomonas putida TaxID=303 RepID=UPI0015BCE1D7|nr:hypothetical protein [Pseudomonas putida]
MIRALALILLIRIRIDNLPLDPRVYDFGVNIPQIGAPLLPAVRVRPHDGQQQILFTEQVIGIDQPEIFVGTIRVCRAPELDLCSSSPCLDGLGGGEMDMENVFEVKRLIPAEDIGEVTTELVVMEIDEEVVPA